jgi:alpha-galactosidase
MKSLGLSDVGYEYVGIDDCYSEKQRSPQGDIVASTWTPSLEDTDRG